MTIEHETLTLGVACQDADGGRLLLPNFQRGFVWNSEAQASLVASVLLGIPSGALLLIHGHQGDFNSRAMGTVTPFEPSGPEFPCRFVLDGQQRLTTLRHVFGDTFASDWTSAWAHSPSGLHARWSCQVIPPVDPSTGQRDEADDLFGYMNLKFEGLPPEPELLVSSALRMHHIYKTKHLNAWYHPAFMTEVGPEQRRTEIAHHAAEEGEVPLWRVLHESDASGTLAGLSLRRIAERRRDWLKASYADQSMERSLVEELVAEATLTGDRGTEADLVGFALDERANSWRNGVNATLNSARTYMFSTIELAQDELAKAVVVFESINRGGQPLNVFDLVSAKYASFDRDALPLSSRVMERINSTTPMKVPTALREREHWNPRIGLLTTDDSLTNSFTNCFLQTLSCGLQIGGVKRARSGALLSVSFIKKEMLLKLKPEEIADGTEMSADAVRDAWMFLQVRCAIPTESALRNKMLLLPLALAFAQAGPRHRNRRFFDKLEYWYWTAVLSGAYVSNQNEQAIQDATNLLSWVGSSDPENPFRGREDLCMNQVQYSDKATLLRQGEEFVGTDVGAYLLQFVAAAGGKDILTGEKLKVWKQDIQDHHLIPLGSATTVGQSSREIRQESGSRDLARVLNSPLNRAYVLADSNLKISASPLPQYIQDIQEAALASLYLPRDKVQTGLNARNTDEVREVLGERFERIRGAVFQHLGDLRD